MSLALPLGLCKFCLVLRDCFYFRIIFYVFLICICNLFYVQFYFNFILIYGGLFSLSHMITCFYYFFFFYPYTLPSAVLSAVRSTVLFPIICYHASPSRLVSTHVISLRTSRWLLSTITRIRLLSSTTTIKFPFIGMF